MPDDLIEKMATNKCLPLLFAHEPNRMIWINWKRKNTIFFLRKNFIAQFFPFINKEILFPNNDAWPDTRKNEAYTCCRFITLFYGIDAFHKSTSSHEWLQKHQLNEMLFFFVFALHSKRLTGDFKSAYGLTQFIVSASPTQSISRKLNVRNAK